MSEHCVCIYFVVLFARGRPWLRPCCGARRKENLKASECAALRPTKDINKLYCLHLTADNVKPVPSGSSEVTQSGRVRWSGTWHPEENASFFVRVRAAAAAGCLLITFLAIHQARGRRPAGLLGPIYILLCHLITNNNVVIKRTHEI